VQNVERVRDREQIDLTVDPPPDLVIAIDIHSSSLDRFPIFASIGVPEVWRYDGTRVAIYLLRDGAYQEQGTSQAFPGLTGQVVIQFIEESKTLQRTA
jgi:Uma2 family endonuclease